MRSYDGEEPESETSSTKGKCFLLVDGEKSSNRLNIVSHVKELRECFSDDVPFIRTPTDTGNRRNVRDAEYPRFAETDVSNDALKAQYDVKLYELHGANLGLDRKFCDDFYYVSGRNMQDLSCASNRSNSNFSFEQDNASDQSIKRKNITANNFIKDTFNSKHYDGMKPQQKGEESSDESIENFRMKRKSSLAVSDTNPSVISEVSSTSYRSLAEFGPLDIYIDDLFMVPLISQGNTLQKQTALIGRPGPEAFSINEVHKVITNRGVDVRQQVQLPVGSSVRIGDANPKIDCEPDHFADVKRLKKVDLMECFNIMDKNFQEKYKVAPTRSNFKEKEAELLSYIRSEMSSVKFIEKDCSEMNHVNYAKICLNNMSYVKKHALMISLLKDFYGEAWCLTCSKIRNIETRTNNVKSSSDVLEEKMQNLMENFENLMKNSKSNDKRLGKLFEKIDANDLIKAREEFFNVRSMVERRSSLLEEIKRRVTDLNMMSTNYVEDIPESSPPVPQYQYRRLKLALDVNSLELTEILNVMKGIYELNVKNFCVDEHK